MVRGSDRGEPEAASASGPGDAEVGGEGCIAMMDPGRFPDWDERLPEGPHRSVFHTQAWARVLKEAYGYTPCYLVLDQERTRRAVLPLMEVRSWITGVRGVALPFSDECPILDTSDLAGPALTGQALELGRARGWRHVEFRGGRRPDPDARPYATYVRHELALASEEGAMEEAMRPALRRAVRKAERSGVRVSFSSRPEDMDCYYGLHCRTRQRQGLPPQPRRFFRLISKHLMGNGLAEVGLAWHDGSPVSGAVFFRMGGLVHYKFGANDLKWQELRPSSLLMASAIKRFANSGCKVFSLGRTDAGHEGLRQFKRSFGAKEWPLEYYRLDVRTGQCVVGSSGQDNRSWRMFRWLPLWGGRLVGRIGYRHLG